MPLLSLITILCILNLNKDFVVVLPILYLLIFLYKARSSITLIDLLYFLFMFPVHYFISGRASLANFYPTLITKRPIFNKLDQMFSLSILILIVGSKNIDGFDDYIYLDRNYIGLVIFLVFILVESDSRLVNLLKWFCLLVGFSLVSRLYILALLCWFLLMNLDCKLIKLGFAKILTFFIASLLATSLFMEISDLSDYKLTSTNDLDRVISLRDGSNLQRLNAFNNYINFAIKDHNYLLPIDQVQYDLEYDDVTTPHNTFLTIIYNNGLLLGLVYILYLSYKLRKSMVSIRLIVPLFMYVTILGGVFYGPTILLAAMSIKKHSEFIDE